MLVAVGRVGCPTAFTLSDDKLSGQRGGAQALYFSSGTPSEGVMGPGGWPANGSGFARRSLPSIPPAIARAVEASPHFVLHRSSTAAGPTVPDGTSADKASASRKKPRVQPPSLPEGAESRLPTGEQSALQAQETEAAERRKARMIAEAAEMVLQMKSSTASAASALPVSTSSFLSSFSTLTGSRVLSSAVFPNHDTPATITGPGTGLFKLQGLVGLNPFLNSSISACGLPATHFKTTSNPPSSPARDSQRVATYY